MYERLEEGRADRTCLPPQKSPMRGRLQEQVE
jgi:hypothetical protein